MKIQEILIENQIPSFADRHFEVDGYVYSTAEDRDDDVTKIEHYLETPFGEVIDIDWSPYKTMSREDVELYIKLGAPKRIGIGPLNREDLKRLDSDEMNEQALTEEQFDEAAGEKDACYHIVKSRYKVWPSAYASGALVKCRKVGAKNWGNSKK